MLGSNENARQYMLQYIGYIYTGHVYMLGNHGYIYTSQVVINGPLSSSRSDEEVNVVMLLEEY